MPADPYSNEEAADREDVGDSDAEDEIVFLTVEQVVALHREVILTSKDPRESLAIRDPGLLESAVANPQATWGGQYLYESLAAMAGAYLCGLAWNHAFENGNKRVALSAASTFLRMNGYHLVLTQDEAFILTMNVVTHTWNQDEAADRLANGMKEL